jgi:steroid delta-isomerase-like uncharacterized protein
MTVSSESSPEPAGERSPAEVARSYFAAVSARDAAAMAAHWHSEGVDDLVPVGVMRGPAEIRGLFEELFAALPDLETTVDQVTADDRRAAVQWRMRGTFSGGPFQGLDPTGGTIALRGVDVVEVEGDRIVRNTAYYDGLEFARGVGMLPEQDSGAERAMFTAFNGVTKARAALRDLLER